VDYDNKMDWYRVLKWNQIFTQNTDQVQGVAMGINNLQQYLYKTWSKI